MLAHYKASARNAAFWLAIGSFLLAVELICLQFLWGGFLLTVGAFLLAVGAFYLQLKLFCLLWESGPKKHPKRL